MRRRAARRASFRRASRRSGLTVLQAFGGGSEGVRFADPADDARFDRLLHAHYRFDCAPCRAGKAGDVRFERERANDLPTLKTLLEA